MDRATAVSSCPAAAPLRLFALARAEAGLTAAFVPDFTVARDALTTGAGAAFAVPAAVCFLAEGVAPAEDDSTEEAAVLAAWPVRATSAALPAAFFPPVVFAIAKFTSAQKTNR
ncbi:hypothetical protein [Burkholderia sp. TSV86]|uniref:hypothetical protein n=1 Tax=Burkholderia sp. TSV86 TaxID=1385594 RepID=UPI000752A356|nr:hypothetical protein [Burkholderia sp. TSV86]KVE36350.1 hypothetical protein WS68_04690 [Burkholderia sp. TSV86]